MRCLSTILFAIFSIYLLSSWDIIIAHYACFCEEINQCVPDSKIYINYTFSNITRKGKGYFEVLEKIDSKPNLEVSISAYHVPTQRDYIPVFYNITKMDVCVLLNTDMFILPYFRQFAYLEKFCPIHKRVHVIRESSLTSKHPLLHPMDCWKFEFKLSKKTGKCSLVSDIRFNFYPQYNPHVTNVQLDARYAIILEETSHCMPNSNIIINYTYSTITRKGEGYCDILEKIELDSNMQVSFSVYHVPNQHDVIPVAINVTNMDICVLLNSDIIILPYIRHFVYVERFCPIQKGRYMVLKSSMISKHNYMYSMGCYRGEIHIFYKQKKNMFACMRYSIQILPSLNSKFYKCT